MNAFIPRFIQRCCLPIANQNDAVTRTVGTMFNHEQTKVVGIVSDSLMRDRYDTSVQGLAVKTLATVVVGFLTLSVYGIYTAIMDIVDVSCEKSDRMQCAELVGSIFSAVKKVDISDPDIAFIVIDLGEDGKYKLEDRNEALTLIRCDEGEEKVMARFEHRTFRQLVNKLAYIKEQDNQQSDHAIEEFEVVDKSDSSSEVENYNRALNELKKGVMDKDYGLNNYSLDVAIREFLKSLTNTDVLEIDPKQIIAKDFVVTTSLARSKEGALEAINEHRCGEHRNKIALIPYGAIDRGDFGFVKLEDHLTLLIVTKGAVVLIDPKWGIAHGLNNLETLTTRALNWQDDTINCGFFVYHMVTEVITAYVSGRLNFEDEGQESAAKTLINFIERLKKPLPEDIRAGMAEIYKSNSENVVGLETI